MVTVHRSTWRNTLEDFNVHVNLRKVFCYIIGKQFGGEMRSSQQW
jgi:hypothetical protein